MQINRVFIYGCVKWTFALLLGLECALIFIVSAAHTVGYTFFILQKGVTLDETPI